MTQLGLAGKTRTKVMVLPYTLAIGNMIDEEFIEMERLRLGNLFEQEYECRFLGSGMAAIEAELIDRNIGDYEMDE